MDSFVHKYAGLVAGVLSGFDRLIFRGTLRTLAFTKGMMGYLWAAGVGSGRQGRDPAGESPAVSIARFGHVAMPRPMSGNCLGIAWCKRSGRRADTEPQRWVQPVGLASMGA